MLWLVDATCAEEQVNELAPKILPLCKGNRLVVVLNKSDLVKDSEKGLSAIQNSLKHIAEVAESSRKISAFANVPDSSRLNDAPDLSTTSEKTDIRYISIAAKSQTNLA